MNGPPKVSEFDLIIYGQQYIFRLDVSVDDLVIVGVFQCLDHLVDVECRSLLTELALFLQYFVQLPVWGVVQNDVDPPLVVEKTMHIQNVWMLQVTVDLYFSPQLEYNVAVYDLLLRDHFYSDNGFGFAFPRQVYMTVSNFNPISTFLFQDAFPFGNQQQSSRKGGKSCHAVHYKGILVCNI